MFSLHYYPRGEGTKADINLQKYKRDKARAEVNIAGFNWFKNGDCSRDLLIMLSRRNVNLHCNGMKKTKVEY